MILNTSAFHTAGRDNMPVIILKMRKGLTTEQKRRIVREFTDTMVNTAGVQPDLVTIMIEEKELEDIGKGGKLRCDP
jgi:4-oxalocrotonate tautomerase